MSSVKKKKTSMTSKRIMRVSRDIVGACTLGGGEDGCRSGGGPGASGGLRSPDAELKTKATAPRHVNAH